MSTPTLGWSTKVKNLKQRLHLPGTTTATGAIIIAIMGAVAGGVDP